MRVISILLWINPIEKRTHVIQFCERKGRKMRNTSKIKKAVIGLVLGLGLGGRAYGEGLDYTQMSLEELMNASGDDDHIDVDGPVPDAGGGDAH